MQLVQGTLDKSMHTLQLWNLEHQQGLLLRLHRNRVVQGAMAHTVALLEGQQQWTTVGNSAQ